ncbi:hypothetical protein COV93_03805 [Candidatus Woesearchaeota archaeon CG11_big_fil_rev_8_21_14_0_20_43_8]|nr:MAG: hypothetical protein COV93_03805 [Candidatus Woesearchaeota archaeon CG11_big_fil_rev_8_21_14_0_20_43_8]PIO04979.1 MAG: hypothetical protein COT47_06715 [Candidatus Woesearchaeota archaeon CG08_land_8_20_14_0_20_43_7]
MEQKERLKEALIFFGRSFNPGSYKDMCDDGLAKALKHFLIVMFFGFLIFSLVSLPALLKLPDEIDRGLSDFNKFKISIDADMAQPAYIFKPDIVIDINKTLGAMPGNAMVYVDSDSIQYKHKILDLYPLEGTIMLDEISDIADNRSAITAFLASAILFALPGIFIFGYIYFLLKSLLIIILVLLIMSILSSVVSFGIRFRDMLSVCLYASTFLAINLMLKPIIFLYFIPIVVYLVYCVIGMILSGDFSEPKKK